MLVLASPRCCASYNYKGNVHITHTMLIECPAGAGKSTLLRIISGQADHDSGQISRNRGAKIGYLPQVHGSYAKPYCMFLDDRIRQQQQWATSATSWQDQ
jgi:ATPase subunit of ABC transporter with duplicated ATPase domains